MSAGFLLRGNAPHEYRTAVRRVSRIWFGFTKASVSSVTRVNLRTVIVTAAIHRGFGYQLRSEELTVPFNLPALGRCQSVYGVFWT